MGEGLVTTESVRKISFHDPIFVVFVILISYSLILGLLGIFKRLTFFGPGFLVKGRAAVWLGYLYLFLVLVLLYCFWVLFLKY